MRRNNETYDEYYKRMEDNGWLWSTEQVEAAFPLGPIVPAKRGRPPKENITPVATGPRKAMRRKAVLDATGWSVPTLYRKMKEGHFPKSRKLDPDGQTVVWWEDEVIAWQGGFWKPA